MPGQPVTVLMDRGGQRLPGRECIMNGYLNNHIKPLASEED